MIKNFTIIPVLFFLFTNSSKAQFDKTNYIVDRNIKENIDKHTSLTNGVAIGHMEVKMFENDSLIFDTYGKEKKLEFITMTTIKNDTIHIIGFAGMFAGFGFYLDLFNDSCTITHLAKSDTEIYKLNKSDTTLSIGLSVPCLQKSLLLVSKPIFKEGEVIEGIIELTSQDYWELTNGQERKYHMQLKAFFKTEGVKQEK